MVFAGDNRQASAPRRAIYLAVAGLLAAAPPPAAAQAGCADPAATNSGQPGDCSYSCPALQQSPSLGAAFAGATCRIEADGDWSMQSALQASASAGTVRVGGPPAPPPSGGRGGRGGGPAPPPQPTPLIVQGGSAKPSLALRFDVPADSVLAVRYTTMEPFPGPSTVNGGSVSVQSGTVKLDTVVFLKFDSAYADGGAVYAESVSTVELVDCTVSGRRANDGGAVHVDSSTLTVTNCRFDGGCR